MSSTWETFPIQLTGGLTGNIPKLQHGMQAPGAPRQLKNFEPSLSGGYRRINGYNKYLEEKVPNYGSIKVQGSGQTGTVLSVANIFENLSVGDTITVEGNDYEVSSVSFNSNNYTADITLTTSLSPSPADKADVTVADSSNYIRGLWIGSLNENLEVLAIRGGVLYKNNSGWEEVSVGNYGTLTVDGASQTGTTINVSSTEGLTPARGDSFFIDGVEKVYFVSDTTAAGGGASTLTIEPALDSSPAEGASITILNSLTSPKDKARFNRFNFDGTEKLLIVDGINYPSVYSNNTFNVIDSSTDIKGTTHTAEFRDHLFFAKDDLVTFSAPFQESNFEPGDGAGSFRVPSRVTGLIVFREQLIVFTRTSIHRLVGNSSSDFQLSSISNNLGCVSEDTIQEVGGDILYMGPDGIRFLGATERIGDFSLSLASRVIQKRIVDLKQNWVDFQSVVVRSKSQYRIFGLTDGTLRQNCTGYLATQFLDQNINSLQWSELEGICVYIASSNYFDNEDYVIFANDTGYVYRMEQGSSFDGEEIPAKLSTPYMPINDPRYRKTIYKLHTYLDPEGVVGGEVRLDFDFNGADKIQPVSQWFQSGGSFSLYGQATYGTSSYGAKLETVNSSQVVGAGYQVSITYDFSDTNLPFTLDTLILEYATEGRL